jgi:mannose-1-phosphate guanylyltransferase
MVQSVNRGTATGLLLPLLKLLFHEPDPIVVVLPSDHYVHDEGPLEEALRHAIGAAEGEPERVVLLGIEPDAPDPEYGWVLPATGGGDGAVPIASFVEKPGAAAARELMRRGALWNSFMFVANARALLTLYEEAQPELLEACVFFLRSGEWNPDALGALEWKLPPRDFSRDVLERVAGRLRVLKVPSCGWSDLGTSARLSSWMAGHELVLSLAGHDPAFIDAATGPERLFLARPA